MKRFSIAVLFFTITISCSKKKVYFDVFEFSFESYTAPSYIFRFTKSDTVFFREHLPNIYDNANDKLVYYTVVSFKLKNTLDSFVNKINFEKYNSLDSSNYNKSLEDVPAYQFYIQNDKFQKSIVVHTLRPPKQLNQLKNWISIIQEGLRYYKIDTTINFHNAKYANSKVGN